MKDRVNGLDAVFEWADQSGIPIREAWCCRVKALTVMNRISSLKAPGTMESLYRMIAGEELSDGKTSFLCLYPQKNGFYKDRNASSLVLKLRGKGWEKPASTALFR